MNATEFRNRFEQGLDYAAYLSTGTEEQRRRWGQVYDATKISAEQATLLGGFVREMKVLVSSGIWCGDCVQQVPLMQKLAEGSGQIDLRIIDRDAHKEFTDQFAINAGNRVPVVLFMAEDFEFCALAGDRTLSRYRAQAMKKLGAACPIGVVGPDQDELAATLGDWCDEFERVQLMLRLSARLRAVYGD